jgi:replicative DNA helicase
MTIARLDDYRQAPAREPPSNVEAEQALLGSILLNNEAFGQIAGFLRAEHFVEELHRRIFAVIAGLIGESKIASPITVKTFLGEHDLGGGATIAGYLAKLAAEATTVIGARDYAMTVRDLFIRREIIAAAREATDQAFDAPVDMRPAAIAASALERLVELTDDPSTATRATAGASAHKLVERAQAIRDGSAAPLGASTGFAELDGLTGGYRPGELWIVAGRPGMGKSIIAVSSATKVARAGHAVLAFSLELPEDQFTARLLADMAYLARRPVTFSQILRGHLDDEEMWLVVAAQRDLARIPLVVDYSSRLTVIDLRARIHAERKRAAAKGQPLAVVFIDYLKFIQASDRYRGNRVYEVGEISGALKQIAKDEGVCVVLLAQLNRGLESRDDKRPGLADLRESGDLEQDADVVAFLHRDAYFIQKSPAYRASDPEAFDAFDTAKHKAEIILGKNRSGPTKTVDLWCDVGCSTIATQQPG